MEASSPDLVAPLCWSGWRRSRTGSCSPD